MAHILEGKTIRDEIKKDLEIRIKTLKQREFQPTLIIIQVGDNPASNSYIKMKKLFGESIGVNVVHNKYKEDISQEYLIKEIKKFNKDKSIHGTLVQLPLPTYLNKKEILESIDPSKDVDALNSQNTEMLPATTRGVITLIDYYKLNLQGKKTLMIGRSELVGIPTAKALDKRGAIVNVAHSKTEDLKKECLESEIIVSAVGKPGLITKDMVKEGQVIIDIGITNINGKIMGDADFENVKEVVSAITPVPGGIGPLTVACLFQNLLDLIVL